MKHKIYIFLFFTVLGSLLSKTIPKSDPINIIESNAKKMIGNPAEIFIELFKKLSQVTIDKISGLGIQNEESSSLSKDDKSKRYEKSEEYSDIENIGSDDESLNGSGSEEEQTDTSAEESLDDSSSDESIELDDGFKAEILKIDFKLEKIDKDIKSIMNNPVLNEEKHSLAKSEFEKDYSSLKTKFLKVMEDFSNTLYGYTKIIGLKPKKLVERAFKGCPGGDECYYDLDESTSTLEMDGKIKILEKEIQINLNLSIFKHHQFHRTQALFIHRYKTAKWNYLKELLTISKELSVFDAKAQSKKVKDKADAEKMEEDLLYRNEQSLF